MSEVLNKHSEQSNENIGRPRGLGPLQIREKRLAYTLLLPTFIIVFSVVLFPLLANFWISFKPVELGDLRAPSAVANERMKGKPKIAGDSVEVSYRIRNSSKRGSIDKVVMTDILPVGLRLDITDPRCSLQAQILVCDMGDFASGQREDIKFHGTVSQAFLDKGVKPRSSKPTFTGVPDNILTNSIFTLKNYKKIFASNEFWDILLVSMYYTIFGTLGALVLGLFAAQLLNMTFAGRGILRGLFLFPYVAPVIAVAFAWVLLLDAGPGGTLNAVLQQVGAIDGPINFLGQRSFPITIFGVTFKFPVALTTVIIFESWRYFPLSFLFILARMQSISTDMYEAAEIDGATPIQQFWYISLPQLAGILAILFLLRFIWTFNKFDDIFLLTGGAAGTRTLTVDVYEQAFAVSNLGAGAAVAVTVLIVLLCSALLFFKFAPQDDN